MGFRLLTPNTPSQNGAKYHDTPHHSVPSPMPVVNKLIQAKLLARQKRIEKKNVKAVRPVVDNAPPAGYHAPQFNAKRAAMRQDR